MANVIEFRCLLVLVLLVVYLWNICLLKKLMIRIIYRFHVYYHIRKILKILQIPLAYDNSFHKYNNPYSREMLMKICSKYGEIKDILQHSKVKLGKLK